jgi:hypothetical protein
MRLPMIKYGNITLTIITIPRCSLHYFFINREIKTRPIYPFIPDITSTSGRLHIEFIRLFNYSYRLIGKLIPFFAGSGVHLPQTNRELFNFLRPVFSSPLKAKVGSTLTKTSRLQKETINSAENCRKSFFS